MQEKLEVTQSQQDFVDLHRLLTVAGWRDLEHFGRGCGLSVETIQAAFACDPKVGERIYATVESVLRASLVLHCQDDEVLRHAMETVNRWQDRLTLMQRAA